MNGAQFDKDMNLDFTAACDSVRGLGTFVTVVKTYVCMQSVVTVCTVKKVDIQTLHGRLMGWVDVMQAGFQMRTGMEDLESKMQ